MARRFLRAGHAVHRQRSVVPFIALGGTVVAVRFVVLRASGVAVEAHRAVASIIIDFSRMRPIDRERGVVDAETVAVGVALGEQTSLKYFVGGGTGGGKILTATGYQCLKFYLRLNCQH
ncbi:MAG: hypothetical protein MPW16_00485 [Candidatus Manganitrophus sp.]|nr:MAG: hypothetical protein MPW16_00485 [Candidatus Manganitrophus sp.]